MSRNEQDAQRYDLVIIASRRKRVLARDLGISDEALATGCVWFPGEAKPGNAAQNAPGWEIGSRVISACLPDLPVEPPRSSVQHRARHAGVVEELRDQHYNATTTCG